MMTEKTEKDLNLSPPYKSGRRISFLDLFTYLFCTASLVISIYTYYYQLSVENKVFKCSQLESKVESLESEIRTLNKKHATATLFNDDEFPDVANVVKKVALQEFGLERLKRDISQLKVTRRENRQASVQQSPECICPAGK